MSLGLTIQKVKDEEGEFFIVAVAEGNDRGMVIGPNGVTFHCDNEPPPYFTHVEFQAMIKMYEICKNDLIPQPIPT